VFLQDITTALLHVSFLSRADIADMFEGQCRWKQFHPHLVSARPGACSIKGALELNIGITSVRNKVFFGARFYCALLTLHVSAPFDGHLQVVHKHKIFKVVTIYSTDPLSSHV
jgi:hypothetical protein